MSLSNYLKILIISILVAACGKYSPPVPPESLAPKSVQDLKVTASIEGVSFEWDVPENDRRGKGKTMTGYEILRKDLIKEDVMLLILR
ncbi:MAG: hypothetical protein R3A13_12815 [Bdellovibrionota bacterium]